MACGCQAGQYGAVATPDTAAEKWQAAPKDAPVQVFEGPRAEEEARLYAARNGGGSVRPWQE